MPIISPLITTAIYEGKKKASYSGDKNLPRRSARWKYDPAMLLCWYRIDPKRRVGLYTRTVKRN